MRETVQRRISEVFTHLRFLTDRYIALNDIARDEFHHTRQSITAIESRLFILENKLIGLEKGLHNITNGDSTGKK